jgi:hypothetical protein
MICCRAVGAAVVADGGLRQPRAGACEGWNYTLRLYRPRAEILSRKWKFPEPRPIS